MAVREVIIPWRSQPTEMVGIDQTGPFSAGLVLAVASHGGVTRDVVSGALPITGVGGRLNVAFTFGQARSYVAGSDSFLTPASLNAPSSYSWLVRAKFTTFNSFSGIFCKNSDTGTATGFGSFRNSATGFLNLTHTNSAGLDTELTTNLTSAGVVTIVVTWNGATFNYYRDGVKVASGAYATAVTSGNGYLRVCSNRDAGNTTATHDHTVIWANRVLSEAEALYLTTGDNSYEIFEPQRIWVPVAAAGGVTITGTPGNAVAAGVAARVSQARAVTGTAGNAAAAGVTAQINQARTVTGAVGNAVAAGVTATVNRATAITGTTGNAVAAGVSATITTTGAVAVTGTPGNAVAAGVQAWINQARVITGTPGNATATGVHATITTASGVTITGTPGNAVAAGVAATFTRNVAITAGPGNAVAAGVTATVSNGSATTAAAGWYDDDKPKRKKKFFAEVDGKLLVFNSAQAATKAINNRKADPEPVEAVRKPKAPKPVQTVDLPSVEAYAKESGRQADYLTAINNKHFEAILRMFSDMEDEDDVEMLLLAL